MSARGTGGLSYHLTALYYRNSLWVPFRFDVERWLEKWTTPSDHLILIGPSAGWTLPRTFLARFKRIEVVEPDPLARILFRIKMRHVSVDFHSRRDLLPWTKAGDASALETFLNERKDAAVLFCNVLGQAPLLLGKNRGAIHEKSSRSLLEALKDRIWASYHDVFSVSHKKSKKRSGESPFHAEWLPPLRSMPTDELAAKVYRGDDPLTDHETLFLSREHATDFSVWKLTTRQTHLIGFVRSDR